MVKNMEIHTVFTANNILQEDLTNIQTDHNAVANLHGEFQALCKVHRALGIAANQVGLRENLFYVAAEVKLLPCAGGHLCINPEWQPHKQGRKFVSRAEGFLSLPMSAQSTVPRRFDVERYTRICAIWTNTQGHRISRTLTGTAAIVFQHEHAHLRGELLTDVGEELES